MSSVLILSCSLYTCHYGERRADFCGCTCPTWEYLLMRKLVEFVNVSGLFFPLIQLCLLAGEKGLDSSHYSWLLGPLFFLNFHKLKNRFLSLSLSLSLTHTHTHTHRHIDTQTHTHPSILWSHSGLLDLFPIVFFKLPVVHINYISFCSFFLPLFVIFSLLEKAFSWNIQI